MLAKNSTIAKETFYPHYISWSLDDIREYNMLILILDEYHLYDLMITILFSLVKK